MFVCLFVCVFGVKVAHVLQERVAKFGHKNYENATKLKVTLTTSTLHTHTHKHIYRQSQSHAQLQRLRSAQARKKSAPRSEYERRLKSLSIFGVQFPVFGLRQQK